jgi:hypothetical protein
LPEGTAETRDIFEIMHTMRAMRRLKADPVPDELIRKILLAGQAAANAGNTQRWRFLVLKNHPGKKVVQSYYKKLFYEVVGPRYRNSAPPPGSDQQKQLRQMAANQYLTDHYHEAPVWIVACLEDAETRRLACMEGCFLIARCTWPGASSCRGGRCPQPGDQRQDLGEHLSRHRNFGHLEGHVASMADNLRDSAKTVISTANPDVIYGLAFVDLKDGPLVFEAAPQMQGLLDDFWHRPLTDVGLAGPNQGKGARTGRTGADNNVINFA